ncbi:hypothetical protein BZL30_7574 [Mycobacterium kansasii]|uniref:Uncharacterized protein n=1 Tax=Mycobacterium kansasii TaxID=1768 RepID=A0A1V3WKY1_MYCKA|nr:hypothetical protein BZL30_7574 [Mycobacterium kansasii]
MTRRTSLLVELFGARFRALSLRAASVIGTSPSVPSAAVVGA